MSKNYTGLEEYLSEYLNSIPDEGSFVYCENNVVNILTLYYANIAKENGIDFEVGLSVPSELPVADSDLGCLLGNLLENAIDACHPIKDVERKIVFHGKLSCGNALIFTIDNTCQTEVKQASDGGYLSSKHSGAGFGIRSAQSVVKKHNGVLRIEQTETLFCVSVLMKI